ncbi:hypothetical protein, partial [Rhizobium sp.]|uniref:hypothetical protein n=1 Tax=Rhizobium sp. TaxID=391 RepID=UPI0028ACD3EE
AFVGPAAFRIGELAIGGDLVVAHYAAFRVAGITSPKPGCCQAPVLRRKFSARSQVREMADNGAARRNAAVAKG